MKVGATSPRAWKYAAYAGATGSAILWVLATFTGWINSVSFVSHISMFTMIVSFLAMARSDAPSQKEDI